jgi:hypothetical protein
VTRFRLVDEGALTALLNTSGGELAGRAALTALSGADALNAALLQLQPVECSSLFWFVLLPFLSQVTRGNSQCR